MAMRQSTPRGQMTRGANSGPAIMLIPPAIRATFMPNPPLQHYLKPKLRRKHPITGVSSLVVQFEKKPPPERIIQPTPMSQKEEKRRRKQTDHLLKLEPMIQRYRNEQKEFGGDYKGMNCYNTLFVGRLAYEVAEGKLLREMEGFGPVKDIQIVKDLQRKSRGYAFVEYENEEDMKRAYRAADAMSIDGREIVVDVERGHTVPTWLPRRLGGGLGGTRLGGKLENVTRPGRFDPTRPDAPPPQPGPGGSMVAGMGRGDGPPPPPLMNDYHQGSGRGGSYRDGPAPHMNHGHGRSGYDGPAPEWGRGGFDDRTRRRSRSPPHDHREVRRRY
jgi:U1 small nuclear ribonucleoprotein